MTAMTVTLTIVSKNNTHVDVHMLDVNMMVTWLSDV